MLKVKFFITPLLSILACTALAQQYSIASKNPSQNTSEPVIENKTGDKENSTKKPSIKPKKTAIQDTITTREEISEDLSVSFPVDI